MTYREQLLVANFIKEAAAGDQTLKFLNHLRRQGIGGGFFQRGALFRRDPTKKLEKLTQKTRDTKSVLEPFWRGRYESLTSRGTTPMKDVFQRGVRNVGPGKEPGGGANPYQNPFTMMRELFGAKVTGMGLTRDRNRLAKHLKTMRGQNLQRNIPRSKTPPSRPAYNRNPKEYPVMDRRLNPPKKKQPKKKQSQGKPQGKKRNNNGQPNRS